VATPRKKNPQKAGRKTLYKQEYDEQAYKYSLLSLTELQMSDLFGVTEKTFNNWKKNHPTFLQSIVKGKEPADAEVAHSLNERAKGYEYQEAVPIKVKHVEYENGKRKRETEKVEIVMVTRIVPPDTRAIQYWMNNRRRKRQAPTEGQEPDNTWAERHEIDHTTKGDKMPAAHIYLPTEMGEDEVVIGNMPTPTE
jgi:hypothetical protein